MRSHSTEGSFSVNFNHASNRKLIDLENSYQDMFSRWRPLLVFGLLAIAGSTGYVAIQRKRKAATQVAEQKERNLGKF